MSQLDLIAATAFGLEGIVARELRALGFDAKGGATGRVHFRGDAEAIVRANLWLRSADRVLIRLGEFPAGDFDALFEQAGALPWEAWIGPRFAFPVNGRSRNSALTSVPAIQRTVKKAIVERLGRGHRVEELPETGPRCAVQVALQDDVATLTLDTTGPSLHKRGYRTFHAAAQIKETLAAALVQLSFWISGRPLIDPFCGTGTIAIEAALIGRNVAAGLNRQFDAQQWPSIDGAIWRDMKSDASAQAAASLPQRIVATDIDGESIRLAHRHAEAAGVADDIHFGRRDFRDLTSKRQFGCVITNPPYGERMGETRELRELYEQVPIVLRRLPSWSHYILTAYPELETIVGRPADRRRKLFNGRLECTYYQFHGPKPGSRLASEDELREMAGTANEGLTELSTAVEVPAEVAPGSAPRSVAAARPIAVPAFGGLSAKALAQADAFANRLRKRARHLRRWPTRRRITCYRIYDRDIPEIPLIVDRYDRWLHVAEYQRPHDRTPAQHADWLDLMLRTAGKVLEIPREQVFLKSRRRQRGSRQYERLAEEGRVVQVVEAGLTFEINLSDYIDTGLFLDHRLTRQMVRQAAAGKRFLNLFAYTGSFTVYAAAGGAADTTTVDWSCTYVDWARRNLELNDLIGPQHRLIREDVHDFLQGDRGPGYDLAVVDPPTFSNSKRTQRDWDIQRDHVALLRSVLARLNPGGEIFFSTNSRRFKLDEAALGGVSIREISRQTVPEDFRNRRIHRCWRMQPSEAQ